MPLPRTFVMRSLVLLLALSLAAGPAWAETVRVATSVANVRSGPGTASRVIGSVVKDDLLEVLERAGDWLRVRVQRTGLEGYVAARLVAPHAAPAPAAPAAPAAAPSGAVGPASGPVAIQHRDVGCVVAGRHPRLDACFSPAENVGRAQVHFRAQEEGPWFYVDMKPEGSCHSALLPKPKKDIGRFHYFIYVVDRAFSTAQQPGPAPDQSYAPRVVGREMECSKEMMIAVGQNAASVVVGIARDAGGKILDAAAAQVLEAKTPLAGFSADGVSLASTGAAPGSPASTADASTGEGSTRARQGGGLGKGVIIGGAAGAAVLVAVAAGGGGGDGGSGSSGSSGSGSSGNSPTAPGAATLSGRWTGRIAEGRGITTTFSEAGVTCTVREDVTVDFNQSGSSVTGTGSSNSISIECSDPRLSQLASMIGSTGSGTVSGTVAGNSFNLTIPVDVGATWMFTGTFTSSTFDATGTLSVEGATFSSTWRMAR